MNWAVLKPPSFSLFYPLYFPSSFYSESGGFSYNLKFRTYTLTLPNCNFESLYRLFPFILHRIHTLEGSAPLIQKNKRSNPHKYFHPTSPFFIFQYPSNISFPFSKNRKYHTFHFGNPPLFLYSLLLKRQLKKHFKPNQK